MNPLVSIIIPCYGQAQFLPWAIESALAQSYPAIETIVINDGSPDQTETVAQRYSGRILYHWQHNQGLSAARNTGIARASGKYVLCLDADDRLHNDAIAWLMGAAAGRDNVLCVMGARGFERDDCLEGGKEWLPSCDRARAPICSCVTSARRTWCWDRGRCWRKSAASTCA